MIDPNEIEWMGKKVRVMGRDELVDFIGQLDSLIARHAHSTPEALRLEKERLGSAAFPIGEMEDAERAFFDGLCKRGLAKLINEENRFCYKITAKGLMSWMKGDPA